jgi:thiol-disulfide isomerase/thioredoxin
MLSRRSALIAAIAASAAALAPALAAGPQNFDNEAFADAQKAGLPILVAIHSSRCSICQAQKPILSELLAEPRFKDLAYFAIDFDRQKDLVRRFGAKRPSTLITFKGRTERSRSVGDSSQASISALLNTAL